MIKLMTYNIRVGVETSTQALVEAVQAVGTPDLLGLQEVGVRWRMGEGLDQPAVMAEGLKLAASAFAGALVDQAGGQFGVALLSRWPLVDVTRTYLPCPEEEQRVLLTARVLAPTPLTAFVTHFSLTPAHRLAQAHAVGDAIRATAGPCVLLGDLNDLPGSEAVTLAEGPLLDCFTAVGEGEPITFSVAKPHRCIDYLACGGGLRPIGPCRVERLARASDHFPLSCLVG